VELTNRLAPVFEAAYLRPWWDAPLSAPGTLLNDAPRCLDIYLPLAGSSEAHFVPTRRYGFYLLACIIGAAQERLASGRSHPPLLIVLTEGSGWWAGSLLRRYRDLLAQAGIAVLTTCSQLPSVLIGSYLLAETATWWLHSLTPADAWVLRRCLQRWNVETDLPLTRMPPGIAVLKTESGQDSPLVATVDTRNLCQPGSTL
jgi:hypothetical protein